MGSEGAEARAYADRGNALARGGRGAAALVEYDAAIALAPDCASFRCFRALELLRQGRYREGFSEYEWRWAAWGAPLGERYWRGAEDVAGRRVLLHAEQGFGDTLQFIRYAPLLVARGAVVEIAVPAPLLALVAELADISVRDLDDERPAAYELFCPLLSLPHAFGTDLDTIPARVPYLRPAADRVAYWRDRLPATTGPRVGIVWAGSGSVERAGDAQRAIPFDVLAPLLAAPGVQFVNLHPSAGFRDFSDTAAVISLLDLVITIDTAVAHLAGALGKPVWIMLPEPADWRWLVGREDSPWYPTARLFRQPRPGDWAAVVGSVTDELRRRAWQLAR